MSRRDLRDRVLSRLTVEPDTNCLLWQGSTARGYGIVFAGGRTVKVHRLMYEWFVGPIPPGMVIDHLCRVTHCASPAHLEVVTQGENVRRGLLGTAHFNSAKTHCPQGHAYDGRSSTGARVCRTCVKASQRRSRGGKRPGRRWELDELNRFIASMRVGGAS